MAASNKLSNMQLELLKLFSLDLSDTQLLEIKSLLAEYFASKATSEMDKLFQENNWGEKKIEEWSKEHMRTKYEDQ